MAAGVGSDVAGVEHGQLLAVGAHGGQLPGGHPGGAQIGSAHEGVLDAAGGTVEVDAAVEAVQGIAVEVQMHRRALVEDPDRVEGVAHHAVGVAPSQGALAPGLQPALLLVAAVVDALEVPVVLRAPHPGDDRPGAVVVRGLGLAGQPGRGVQAQPAVGIDAQLVDRHQRPGVHRERLGVEQVLVQGQSGQHGADRVEQFVRGPERVPQAPDLVQRILDGLVPPSHRRRGAHSRPLPIPPSTEIDWPVM